MRRLRIKFVIFMGGLQTKIQDIVDYKEYNTVNHLFQLAMLAEKELQGRQPTRLKSSFMPRHTSTTPSTSRAPATACFSMRPSTSRAPSTSMTPPLAPHASKTTPPAPHATAKPSSSSITSTGRTSDIKCHRCHGVGAIVPARNPTLPLMMEVMYVLMMLKMILHFKLIMQVTLTMTMPRSLGVSIQRSIAPKPMWCSGF
jgi:hypothetical protein